MTQPPSQPRQLTAEEAFERAFAAQTAGRLEEAEGIYRAILAAVPSPETASNLAVVLEELGRDQDAERVLREAIGHSPDAQRLQWQLSLNLLRQGRYAEAWPLFEHRTWNDPGRRPNLSFPEWRGQAVTSLLVVHEQGLGDQIQYARFAADLARKGVRVTILCHPALTRLFEGMGVHAISAQGSIDIPRHDAWVLSASLPLWTGATLENLPSTPYLPSRQGGEGVGFIGFGNRKHINDANRSLPADKIAEMLSWPGVRSLQPEDTQVRDVADTAELMKDLELVISVDTVTAHLAGAMGKPVWLLLPWNADWRWMRERVDSPWYPSMRIFRQPKPGDWDSVMADVKAALRERGSGR